MINNLLIFGDSYSTHKNHVREGYAFYYSNEGDGPDAPVTKMLPEETWWMRLLENTDARLVLNDSWSGSTIGYTGYHGDCSETSSFICRYKKLDASGFFRENKIDTVIVFGGTNDSWCNAPLGEEKFSAWQESDLYSVLPAVCWFFYELRQKLPEAKVLFVGNCGIKKEITECMKNAALHYGGEYLGLENIDKKSGHPTALGMEQIYMQIREALCR